MAKLSQQERNEMIAVLSMRHNYSLEFLDACTDEVLLKMYEREG
ncbi:MAG: hypothetical protein ABS948_12005 [Solibacillus sp.]